MAESTHPPEGLAPSVQTGEIDDEAVTTPKIAADAVTSAKIPTDAVGSDEIAASAVGTSELDLSMSPTWTGTHTWDTAGGANLSLDESGPFYNTGSAETLNVRNTGAGSVTVQEDGTAVVKENRSLTGGNAIDAIGDLSADRTVAVSTDGIGSNELDGTYPNNSVANADLVNSSVTYSPGTGLTGGGSVALGGSATFNVDPGDDEEISYGAGDDISERYDSGADDFVWQDDNNNTDRLALDRTSGNLIVGGTVDETTSP